MLTMAEITTNVIATHSFVNVQIGQLGREYVRAGLSEKVIRLLDKIGGAIRERVLLEREGVIGEEL